MTVFKEAKIAVMIMALLIADLNSIKFEKVQLYILLFRQL